MQRNITLIVYFWYPTMNRKALFIMVLAAHTPVMAHENNFYGGVALGGGILEITSTANQEYLGVTVPFITNEERYATNVDASLLLTWKQRRQNLVFGVDGDIGWGGQTQKTSGTDPLSSSNILESKLQRGFNLSAMGFLGYACGPWTSALKVGFVGANFTQTLKEFDGDALTHKRTQSHFSPALGLGAFLDRSLGRITLRLDYTCAIHESFDKAFVTDGDTNNFYDSKRPVMHRVMGGVLWKI
jgi:opacity protein-like surface antigen